MFNETPFSFARRWCEIDQIAVAPTSRRKGIGRALMQRAVTEANGEGVRDIEVSSWSFNAQAHRLLLACGFLSMVVRYELRAPEHDSMVTPK